MKYAILSYTVVSDPLSPGALAPGFCLNAGIVRDMLLMGHFTPGTILNDHNGRALVVHGEIETPQKLRAATTTEKT